MKNRAPMWIAAGIALVWLLSKKKTAAHASIVAGDTPWLNNDPRMFQPVVIDGQLYASSDGTNFYPVETLD